MKENVELTLYHGSFIRVDCPDLKRCRPGKDFGKGFYLTTSRKQAERFTKTAMKKALRSGIRVEKNRGIVSVFKVLLPAELSLYRFKDADSEWLHCVAAHRKRGIYSDLLEIYKDYDIIIGKIANDNTNLVITAYLDGIYGDIPSERADEIAISFLEPDNLKDQFCFRTERALASLQFVESYEV